MYSIPYTQANFQVQAERDIIMQKIFEAITAPDVNIRVTAMQCLVNVAYQHYNQVGFYI